MGLIETDGLILKTYALADADKIVVLLTKNQGVIRGVARGAKRLKSRFGSALEIFSIVQISYFQKEDRELVSIGHVELVKSYFEKAGDPHFFESFTYLVELLIEFAQPNDPNERLYRMTKVCLDAAANNSDDFAGIVVYFEIWLLKLGGYLPDWSKCFVCKKAIRENEKTNLQIHFQAICQNCQKSDRNLSVSSQQRKIFLAAQNLSPTKFLDFIKNQNENTREISKILKRLISNILGKEVSATRKSASRA
jgi:DNA repair protein RecO (recombination protein O)